MSLSVHGRAGRTVAGFCTAAAIAVCAVLAPQLTLHAFIPTNLKALGGLLGTSHVKITDEAITELDNEFFGIATLTKPMKKAKEQIQDANADVDQDQKTASKHLDGESFPEAQQRIIDRLNGVTTALASDDAAGARKELGAALHTIQDFYSHSNWVELGGSSPHPGLGRPGSGIGRLPVTTATCQDCTGGIPLLVCPDCSANLITSGLTSGYYGGEDPPFGVKPAGKCSHGGVTDGSARGIFGEGINKDSTDCEFSPHNFLHAAAVAVAKEATKQFIRDIKDLVTQKQLKELLGVGPTLAISIDTTGSMGSVIDGVKQQAIAIVDARLGTDEEPSKYVLSPFNDPDVGPVTVTTDPDEFKSAISALFASGGGDCPELSQSGMLQGLAASDEGGDLFMFTDASAKDASLAGNVSSLATSKDIRVYPILFGSCSPIDPAYTRAAADSGGQLFFLDRSEAGNITKLADLIVRSNAASVLLVDDTAAGIAKTYTLPVDSTMTSVTFSVGGPLTGTSVVLTRPDGTIVQPTDPGVTVLSLTGGFLCDPFCEIVGGGLVYSVASPPTGMWSVAVNGTGDFSLKVSGESSLDLSSFRFVQLGGRPGHQGFYPIDGLPPAGSEATVDSVISGPFNSTQFQLRDRMNNLLQSLSLSLVPETTDEFSGTVTPPNSSFLVYVTGQDVAGTTYQRVLSGNVRPQTVALLAPVAHDLPAGQTTTYTFTVTNRGAASDTFSVLASDDRGYLTSVSPTLLTLAAGASSDVLTQLRPPDGTPAGTSDTLTVTVQSTSAPDTRNFAVVTSVVTSGDTIPPSTVALQAPTPNAAGWNNSNVTLTLTATDNAGGSGVSQITFSSTGAQAIPQTSVSGSTALITIASEGLTTVTYFATDSAGNAESPNTLTVKLDKTPPTVTFGAASPAANRFGWNNTNVSVPFTTADALSGVAMVTPTASPLLLTTEGRAVTGVVTVTDVAGNVTTARSPAVNIDRTAPEAFIQFDPATKDLLVFGRDPLSGVTAGPVKPIHVGDGHHDDGDDGWRRREDNNDGHDHHDGDDHAVYRIYEVRDLADNVLVLTQRQTRDGDELTSRVVSLSYGHSAAVHPDENLSTFEWTTRFGVLKALTQRIDVGRDRDRLEVTATFDDKQNRTIIKVDGPGPGHDQTIVKHGLALLRLATASGELVIEY